MKLHTGIGPNPRTVRMFLAEKGVSIPIEQVDLVGGENRRDDRELEAKRGRPGGCGRDRLAHIAPASASAQRGHTPSRPAARVTDGT